MKSKVKRERSAHPLNIDSEGQLEWPSPPQLPWSRFSAVDSSGSMQSNLEDRAPGWPELERRSVADDSEAGFQESLADA